MNIRSWWALLLAAALAGCGGTSGPGSPSSGAGPARDTPRGDSVEARIARIESAVLPAVRIAGEPDRTASLAERMEELQVPGVSIAVINGGEIEWVRGYGFADVEQGRRVTTETLFQAASISKPVAAMAALKLVEDGVLSLDQDVNEVLESWKVPENEYTASSPVTLRRLLSHSAGMSVSGFPGYERGETIPDTVGVLDGEGNTAPIRVDIEPGRRWRYSGGGYTVVQLLLSNLSGKPFPELMAETVLEPLDMTNSTYQQPLPEDLRARAASGYRRGTVKVRGDWHVYPEMAAAGLWTTPTDLAKYAVSVQKAMAGEPHAVLSRGMIGQMLTPGLDDHGLGPQIEGDGSRFGHGGSNEGFRCGLDAFVDGSGGVAVMTNADTGGLLARQIMATVAEVYGWDGFELPVKEVVTLDDEHLAALVGRYDAGEYGAASISMADGTLWIELPWGTRTELLPESEDEFFLRLDGTEVRILREGDRITGLVYAGAIRAEKVE